MARRKKPVDFAAMLTKLERCDHQLLSLDVSLQSLEARGMIKAKDNKGRRDFVAHMRDRITRLRLVMTQDETSGSDGIDLGLPNLDDCAGPELEVLNNFLDTRLKLLKDLHDNLARYFIVVTRAAQGRLGSFRAVWWLSQLRRVLDKLDAETMRLTQDEKSLAEVNEKLVNAISGHGKAGHLAGNVGGLIHLFEDVDATSGRIAKLKAAVSREEGKIEEMKEWLTRNDSLLTQAPPSVPLPPLVFTKALEETVKPQSLRHIERNEERLTMARRYVRDFLEQQRVSSELPVQADLMPLFDDPKLSDKDTRAS